MSLETYYFIGNAGWVAGYTCGYTAETHFHGDYGYTLDQAKDKCELGCKADPQCDFANLYFTGSLQTCYLKKAYYSCSNGYLLWGTQPDCCTAHPFYHSFKKGRTCWFVSIRKEWYNILTPMFYLPRRSYTIDFVLIYRYTTANCCNNTRSRARYIFTSPS